VGSKYEPKVIEQAQASLEPGEQVAAALWARRRGASQMATGSLASLAAGSIQSGKSKRAAEAANVELPSPMALAITDRRLLVFGIETSAMGKPGDLQGLAAALPLSEVDSIAVKRLLVGKVLVLTVRGSAIKLEVAAGENAKGMAEAFDRAKAAAV
jgi:hypothetical protein